MNKSIFNHPDIAVQTSQREDGSMKRHKKAQVDTIRQFLEDNGFSSNFKIMQQVHGYNVEIMHEDSEPVAWETDGIISQENVTLGVFTADCLPVFLYDSVTKTIGAVHAGFKGVLLGVLPETIRKFQNIGAKPEDILIGIGPAIGNCCYNVDGKRAEMFRQQFGNSVIEGRDEQFFLDLKKSATVQLEREGILTEHIDISLDCTRCNKDKYFSYRGDSVETYGEMISVIGIK